MSLAKRAIWLRWYPPHTRQTSSRIGLDIILLYLSDCFIASIRYRHRSRRSAMFECGGEDLAPIHISAFLLLCPISQNHGDPSLYIHLLPASLLSHPRNVSFSQILKKIPGCSTSSSLVGRKAI